MEEKAIESFKEAIKINSRYAKAHNDLATVYGRIGKFNLALQEFNEAIRIDKDYADAHYNLGILLEFMKQNDLARKEFEIAARLEPTNQLYVKKLILLG
jgi:Tfp pilus assembly protein PilF